LFAPLALVIRHAKRMHHIVICGLSGATLFFHIIGTVFWKSCTSNVSWFSVQFCLRHFSFQRDVVINVHRS